MEMASEVKSSDQRRLGAAAAHSPFGGQIFRPTRWSLSVSPLVPSRALGRSDHEWLNLCQHKGSRCRPFAGGTANCGVGEAGTIFAPPGAMQTSALSCSRRRRLSAVSLRFVLPLGLACLA